MLDFFLRGFFFFFFCTESLWLCDHFSYCQFKKQAYFSVCCLQNQRILSQAPPDGGQRKGRGGDGRRETRGRSCGCVMPRGPLAPQSDLAHPPLWCFSEGWEAHQSLPTQVPYLTTSATPASRLGLSEGLCNISVVRRDWGPVFPLQLQREKHKTSPKIFFYSFPDL